ncbi:MAG: hypothetical protein PHF37_00505 [Phycisphaerae bacterium]|nr:hypothetical protein [Phycisphaerae bacterium]
MIEITELTMDGTDKEYKIPEDAASIGFQASGGVINMKAAVGGASWTIANGQKEAINSRDIQNGLLYFNGQAGVILQIRLLTGLMA